MEQVALIAIILMIGFCEWREFKLRAEMREISQMVSQFTTSCNARQHELEATLEDLQKGLANIICQLSTAEERQRDIQEYNRKAAVDLGTIVQEYEINGIWLGKDRNKQIDAYEG